MKHFRILTWKVLQLSIFSLLMVISVFAKSGNASNAVTQAFADNAIQGKIFLDLNGDGLDNDGPPQPPVQNLEVILIDEFGAPALATVTDLNGQYLFENIPTGNYFIFLDTLPIQHTLTTPGLDSDLDPLGRFSALINVPPLAPPIQVDAGLQPIPGFQIQGLIWLDENGNGIQDPGEVPIEDLEIILESPPFGPVQTFTDEFGQYVFDYIPPLPNYGLQIPLPPDFGGFTQPNQGTDDNVDSDFDANGQVFLPGFPAPPPNPIILDAGIKPKQIKVNVTTILSGAVRDDNQMGTELNDNGLLPTTEPYSGLGYGIDNPGITFLPGNIPDAVDWVTIELRDKDDSTQVIASKTAILKKDGKVVDPQTGDVPCFEGIDQGTYFVALRHRNHLDIMTQYPVFLDDQKDFVIDFTDPNTPTVGIDAQKPLDGGGLGLWAGDANGDNELKYSGPNRDPQEILIIIGGTDPTQTTIPGYYLEDTNLDGIAKYSGPNRDPQIVLENIGGTDPTQTRKANFPE